MDIQPLEPVARQHRPEGCRNRNPALCIQLVGEVRNEAVQVPHLLQPGPRRLNDPMHEERLGRESGIAHQLGCAGHDLDRTIRATGCLGIAWDYMGVNEGDESK